MSKCPMCEELPRSSALPLFIADMGSSVAVLNSNQLFKGRSLVILKKHATELYQLSPQERQQYCEEMIQVAEALDKACHPDKMNYVVHGNIVAHLHWHLIPRYKDDPYWGSPIDYKPSKKLKNEEYADLIKEIRRHLP